MASCGTQHFQLPSSLSLPGLILPAFLVGPPRPQAQQQAQAAAQQQQAAAAAAQKPLRAIAHTLLEGGLMDPAFYHALGQVGAVLSELMQ